jgi:hypothetical protein
MFATLTALFYQRHFQELDFGRLGFREACAIGDSGMRDNYFDQYVEQVACPARGDVRKCPSLLACSAHDESGQKRLRM